MMRKVYLTLCAASVLFLAASHFLGWTFTSAEAVKGVPRSVRDNPGAYRTHYFGGK